MTSPGIGELRQSKGLPFPLPNRSAFDTDRPMIGAAEASRIARTAASGRSAGERLEAPRAIGARLGGQIEHTLRAPLALAASAARVLADQVDATQTPAVDLIVEALERAEGMLLDVAELLRNDVDSSPPAPCRRMNFTRVCERVLDSIQCRYPMRAMKLESDRRVEGSGDPDAIAAMISRIVVNAIQHGTDGTSVRVKVWGFDERAIVEVWNAGGFPDEVAAAPFFEAFVCARPRLSDGGRGLGLGLHLASRTARAHGGRIEIQSDARNGTTVRIVLPRS